MTETERYLAICCAAAASGKGCGDFPVWVDAEQFYNIAFAHGVAGMVYYALKDAVGVPEALSARLEDAHNKSVYRDLLREEEEKCVFAAFDSADIAYLPLKGSILRSYYPAPDMRVMGDTDVRIDKFARKDARKVMTECGYTFDESKSGHDIYSNKNGNVFELHFQAEDKSAFHQKLIERAIPVGNSGTRLSLNYSDFYIYMISHLARHMRTTGAGLRLFADIKVFYSRCGDKLDGEYVDKTLNEMGLAVFEKEVKKAIHVLFYNAEPDKNTAQLIDYIFSGGVFGSAENYAANRRGDRSKLGFFFASVFPSYGEMKKRFSCLKFLPFLLPLFWVIRWFSLLFRGKKPAKRYAAGAAVSKEQLKSNKQLLTRLGLVNTKSGKVRMTKSDIAIVSLAVLLLVFAIAFISKAFFLEETVRLPHEIVGSDDSSDDVASGEESYFVPPEQNYVTMPYKSGVYEGYVSNGLPNGTGELNLPNGEKYVGSFADGEFNGPGVYHYLDGSKYDGVWFEGTIHGFGTLTLADGSSIYANFIDGEPQGTCSYQNASGDIYEGELKDGKRSGNGRFLWANGDIYEGNYVDGEREGEGKYTYANGDSYSGEWIASVPNGEGVMIIGGDKYTGIFVQGVLEGAGTLETAGGDSYTGYFVNGKCNDDNGVYTFSDGSKYEGHFVGGLFNGQGKFTYTNGDTVKGNFVNGVLQGTAVYYDKSAGVSRYVTYKDGKPV